VNTAGQNQSVDAIRADIEATRERLGDNVEALGAHLNPSLLKQRVKDSVREATIGRVQNMASNAKERVVDTGRSVADVIRENPIPAAMIAGGIGWMLFSSRRKEPRSEFAPVVEYDTDVTAAAQAEPGKARQIADSARGAVDKVKSGASSAAHGIASGAQAAAHGVASGAHTVADRTRAGVQQVGDHLEQNPMMMGAVAAAVGLAVGLSIPGTDREARLMGAKRDALVDKARETVSETKEKVLNVAETVVPEIGDAIKSAAREEGLTA
jgi:ElaB/YqjD/DUF883 family membrane-anchored ribosome-binding protein